MKEKNDEQDVYMEMMLTHFDEIMSILSKSLREYSRRITSEIIDLIVDLIKSYILHTKNDPSQILDWLSAQFNDYYMTDNKDRIFCWSFF